MKQKLEGALLVAVTPGTLKVSGKTWSVKEGSVKWIGGVPAVSYANDSKEPVSLLVLSLTE